MSTRIPMHKINLDLDHIAKIKEAAIQKVDKDTDTYRPEILNRLHLHQSPSPRKTFILSHKQSKLNNIDNDLRPINHSKPSSRTQSKSSTSKRRPHGTLRESERRKNENKQVRRAKKLVDEAKEEERSQHFRSNSTDGERRLATSIRKAHETLLNSYTQSIQTTRALEAEQKEWRHQSPDKRGVNCSPTYEKKGEKWSTKRGALITKLSSKSKSLNPPVFNSGDLLMLSPHTSRYSTKTYGELIARTPTKRDRAVRKIGF